MGCLVELISNIITTSGLASGISMQSWIIDSSFAITNSTVKISPDLQPVLSFCQNSKTYKAKCKILGPGRMGSSCEMKIRVGGGRHEIGLMTHRSLNRLGGGRRREHSGAWEGQGALTKRGEKKRQL